jgi:hypothetical protein
LDENLVKGSVFEHHWNDSRMLCVVLDDIHTGVTLR